LGVRKIPTADDVEQAGLRVVAPLTIPIGNPVVGVNVPDISQSREVTAASFLAHDLAFEYAQIPGSAINPELLDSIHSLVFGNTNPVLAAEQSNYLERGMPAGT